MHFSHFFIFLFVLDQPVEQQQEAIRNVFSGFSLPPSLVFFSVLLSFFVNVVSFAVLCTRPEHVSNFVDAESFFGPVFLCFL